MYSVITVKSTLKSIIKGNLENPNCLEIKQYALKISHWKKNKSLGKL